MTVISFEAMQIDHRKKKHLLVRRPLNAREPVKHTVQETEQHSVKR
jgi:hypothetical protein